MGDFHIPDDPNWQWAYDAILYTVGEQFPKGDPSELKALSIELERFGANLANGIAATQALGLGLQGNLDGPAADAFAQFQQIITRPLPGGIRSALIAGDVADRANQQIDYGQTQIVVAAFMIVLDIAMAMASGFGVALVPAYINIGQRITQALLNRLQNRLHQLIAQLAIQGAEEGLEEGAENVIAQTVVIAKDNKDDGFSWSDLGESIGAGVAIGTVAGGVFLIGGRYFPKLSGTTHGQAGLGAIGETLGELAYLSMVGGLGSFNALATAVSSAVGTYASVYAHDLGAAVGGGPGTPDPAGLEGPGPSKDLAVTGGGPDAVGPGAHGTGEEVGNRPRPDGADLDTGPLGSGDTSTPGTGSGSEGAPSGGLGTTPVAPPGQQPPPGTRPAPSTATPDDGPPWSGRPGDPSGNGSSVPPPAATDLVPGPPAGAGPGLPGFDTPPTVGTPDGAAQAPNGGPSIVDRPPTVTRPDPVPGPDGQLPDPVGTPPGQLPGAGAPVQPPPVQPAPPAAVGSAPPTAPAPPGAPPPVAVQPGQVGGVPTTGQGSPTGPNADNSGTPGPLSPPATSPLAPPAVPGSTATPGPTGTTPVPPGSEVSTTPGSQPTTQSPAPPGPSPITPDQVARPVDTTVDGTVPPPTDQVAGPTVTDLSTSVPPAAPPTAPAAEPFPAPATEQSPTPPTAPSATPGITPTTGASPVPATGTVGSAPPSTTETRTGPTPGTTGRAAPVPSDPPSYLDAVGPAPVEAEAEALPVYADLDPLPPPYEAGQGPPASTPVEPDQHVPGARAPSERSSRTRVRSTSPGPTPTSLPPTTGKVEQPTTPRPATTVEGPDVKIPPSPGAKGRPDADGVGRATALPSGGGKTRLRSVVAPVPPLGKGPWLRDVPPAVFAKSTAETVCVGDPIDVTTGRMIYTETDASLPGLSLGRTHRSDYRWGRSFGPSWASTLDQRIVADGTRAWLLAADGSILTYPLPAEGEEALPLLGRPVPLRRLVGGGWSLTDRDALLLFAPGGDGDEALLSDVATVRTRWHLTRDDEGTPTLLASSSGDRVELRTHAGLVTGALFVPADGSDEVELPAFDYDDRRRLVAVRNSSGDPVRLDYDEDGRITRWVDRNGEWYTYAYDQAGRCVLADGNGGYLRYAFAYGDGDGDGVTTVTDSLGGVHRYEVNDRLQVTAVTDPLGATTRDEWDAAHRLLSRTDPLGRVTRFTYDGAGRPAATVLPDGNHRTIADDDGRTDGVPGTVFDLDGLGRSRSVRLPDGTATEFGWTAEGDLAWRTGPDGSTWRWHYDGEGNLVESIDAAGRTVRFEYGPFDLPTARIDEAGNRTEYGYDTELRLTTVTNPAGQVWRYAYDAAGRLTGETDFDGRTQRYVRDAAGQLTAHTDPAGETTHYRYDLLGRVVERRVGDAVTRLEYDAQGRVTAVLSPEAVVRLERDERGRVVAETIDGHTVRTSYHPELGTVQARTTPSGRSSRWTFDADGRPESLSTGGHLVRFGHDEAGREVSRTVDDVVALRQTFDAAGRLAVQQIAGAAERDFSYDATDRVTAITDTLDGGRSFQSDEVGRIHAVLADGAERERYDYDAAGNLTGTGGERWEFDGTRLLRSDDATFEYDGKGRLVARVDPAGTWRFGWDAEDRIVQVVTPDGDRWRYRYDGFGRRIAKQRLADDDSVAEEVRFAWSGDLLVEQSHRDTTGTTATVSWEYRPDGSTPVTQTDGDELRTVVTDPVGTPTHLVEADGALRWWARRDVWGRDHGPSATPLRFPGQYFDAETGLHYNRFRFYDPATARYLSPDPLGLAGGLNPTAYVSDPLTVADPLGLTSCKVTQPGRNPLGTDAPGRPVAPDGEPSQLPTRAVPPAPEALYGTSPLTEVVTTDPDGNRTVRYQPRPPSLPGTDGTTDGTATHADTWYSEAGPTPAATSPQDSTVEDVRDQLQPLPEPESRPDLRSPDHSTAARRRGRTVGTPTATPFGPVRPVFTPAGLRMLHETDTAHQDHADSLPVGPDYKLAVEGVDGELVAGGHAYDPDVVGGLIENDPGWRGRPITVVACDAGPLFAVGLAKRLPNVPVTAAQKTVFTTGRGHVFSDDVWVTYTADPDGRVDEVVHDQLHMPGGPVPSAADVATADTHWRIATETEIAVQIGGLNGFNLELGETIARAPGLVFKVDSQQRTIGGRTGMVMIVEVVSGPSRVEQWEEAADPATVRAARNIAVNAILSVPAGRAFTLRTVLQGVPGIQFRSPGGRSTGDNVAVQGGQFSAPYTQWTLGMHNHSLPLFLGYAAANYSPTGNQNPRRLVERGLALGQQVAADFRQYTGGRALPWHESRLDGFVAISFPVVAAQLLGAVQAMETGVRMLNKHFLLLAPRVEIRDMRAALSREVRNYLTDRADHVKQLMHGHLESFDRNQRHAQAAHLFDPDTDSADYYGDEDIRNAADNVVHGHRYPDGSAVPFFSLQQELGINPTTDGIDPPGLVGGEFRYLVTMNSNLGGVDHQSDELSAMVRRNAAPPPLTSAQVHQIIQGIRDETQRIGDVIGQIEENLRRDRSPDRVRSSLTNLLEQAQTAAARARTNESYAHELREAAQATFAHNDPARRNARTYHHNTQTQTQLANGLVARIQEHLANAPAPRSSRPPYGGDDGSGGGYPGSYGTGLTTSYGPVSYNSYPSAPPAQYGGGYAPYGSGPYNPFVNLVLVDGTATDPTQPAPRVLDPGLGADGRQRILDDLTTLVNDRSDAVRDFLGQHGSHPDHATATAVWDSFVSAVDYTDQAGLQPAVNLYEQAHGLLAGLDPNNPLPAVESTLDDSDFLPRRQPVTPSATDGPAAVPNDLLRTVPLTDGSDLQVLAANVHATTADTDTDLADFGRRSLGWLDRTGAGGGDRTSIESALMVDEYQRSGRVLDTPPASVPKTLDELRRSYPGGRVTEVGTTQGLMDALGALPKGTRSQGIVAFRAGPVGTTTHVLNVVRYPSGPVVFVDGQLQGLGAVPAVGPEGSVVLVETTDPTGTADEAALAPFTDVPPATVAKTTEQTPTAGDPIDVTTGRMILTETDAVLPGLTLERTHRSDYRWGRSFGPSWASTLDQRVVADGDRARYLAPDGSVLTYPLPEEGEQVLPEVGRALPLRRLVGGGWLLTDPASGRVLVFAAGHGTESLLIDVAEGDLRWSVERDEAGTPTELRSTAGARIGLSSSAGLLTVLWLPNRSGSMQAAYRFGYDRERNLVDVVNSSGEATRFGYADGRIVRWDDRNGEWYTYTYDEAGRCVATDGRGGHLRYRFAYADGLTTVTDSLGAVRRYELNDRFQVVAETDPLGATTRTEWDGANRLVSRTDPLGRTTTYDHDADGRSTTVTRPDGSRSTITYDELGRAMAWTDFDGSTRQRAFDTDGRVLAETDASGEVVRFDRPVENGPGTITQAGPTAIVRDAARLVTSMTNGGSETRYEYDNLGRVAVVEDDRGVTEVGWTLEGELAWRQHPNGDVEEFGYDGEGNLVEAVDPTGRRTRFEYGAFDLVTARVDDAGNRTEYAYDTELRLTAVTDPQGRTWRYTYDPNGRLVEETDPDGRVQRYAYDAAGQLVAHTDAAGEVTRFGHDLLGRVVERRTGSAVTRLTYDAAGRIVAAEDADSEIRLERDAFGRVLAETVNGHTVAVTYDEQFGVVTARTRPSGAVTRWSYDESGRPAVLLAGGQQLRFTYDGGRELSRTWDAGLTVAPPTPEPAPEASRSAPGEVTYTLDALGRPTTRSGPTGDWHFTWDHRNRLATVTTPGDERWRYRYDAFDRRIAKQRQGTKGTVLEETRFVWSGDLLVEQHHHAGDGPVTTTAWEYHPPLAHPVAQLTDGTVRAVVVDGTGTRTTLVGTDGSRPGDPDGIPLGPGGRYLDAETGLQYDGSRYHDPLTGRSLPESRTAPVPVN
ncbi:DUF6531 domain-containing protein [Micromonospora sp. NPDC050187]|uniref:DUF6531 domain-containing protein n=1 Tax=Micromonospora sp. NPDC050187 TaxID=3364277 RepID=UPI0037BB5EB2